MNLPDSFSQYTRELMGEELFNRFVNALADDAPTSIRINAAKCKGTVNGGEKVAWCERGYYLSERPNFTFDPLLHAGWYYVQEASSMFLHKVITQYITTPVTMLDMCAAPGGKSTVAIAALPEGNTLISNEPMRTRAQILAENIQKWGNPNVIVTNNYPNDYAKSGLAFDVILCDVPCSGEGMFRKDENAISEWSTRNVDNCWQLQREIVSQAWQCLNPGGIMIYSTCTFNTKENEENVAWICSELGASVLPVSISDDWKITGSLLKDFNEPVYRFIPGQTRGEGLFMAVLKKADDAEEPIIKRWKKKNVKPQKLGIKPNKEWLCNANSFDLVMQGDTFIAIPNCLSELYPIVASSLKIMSAGITLGQIKGKDIIPDQSLALSTVLNRNAFPTVELSYACAIDYLRKEAITLPDGTPKGIVLVTYHDAPLGFMKNIGNRANNLYPQEWKIKSTHTPDEQTIISL